MPKAAQFLPSAEICESDKGVDLEVCQCLACGLIQLNSDPVPYYKEVIRASDVSVAMKEFRREQFSNFMEKFSLHGKKVIEIGCGRGEYLSIIKQCGVKAFGLEYSHEAVTHCVNNGLKVSRGFIDSSAYRIDDAPFDAFFILSFLEHLPDPCSTIRGIYNNLSDVAVGIIEVPNFNMIIRKKLFSEFISDHLFYFTKDSLRATLSYSGFEVMELHEIWQDYIISAVVKKREKIDLSDFDKYQTKLISEIEGYICGFKNKRVAVWGAGHQALTLMSLANLAGKIKYVVDSALFKQGRYTPATHIPIVSPDVLEQEPVDAIIVMAGGYSNEVVEIISRKFTNKMSISIVKDFGLEIV